MEFDLDYLARQLPALRAGLWLTIQVSALGIAASLAIGLAGAAIRVLRVPVLSPIVAGYVELIRNTPLLVQIFFLFFGLPTIGLRLPLFWSGVLALALWGGAFQTENIRGGLQAVARGIDEAGRALALTRAQYLRLVALPLALRVGLPAFTGLLALLVQSTSLGALVGVTEFLKAGGLVIENSTVMRGVNPAFTVYAVVLATYFAICSVLTALSRMLERRLHAAVAPAPDILART